MERQGTVKERPILFNAEMVRAVLDGRKTQTRRVVKPQPVLESRHYRWQPNPRNDVCVEHMNGAMSPYGAPGNRLWVRETWCRGYTYGGGDAAIYYRASPEDGRYAERISERCGSGNPVNAKWKPSIHMPRWASRITLEVVSVRVERVRDITEEDARAEGISDGGCLNCGCSEPCHCEDPKPDAVDAFIYLWNSINEARGYGWDANPWVWVVEFRRVVQ